MLARHVSLRGAKELDKEQFLIESVCIPPEWIHEAKVCVGFIFLVCESKLEFSCLSHSNHLLL
jgi:hypothetical protein